MLQQASMPQVPLWRQRFIFCLLASVWDMVQSQCSPVPPILVMLWLKEMRQHRKVVHVANSAVTQLQGGHLPKLSTSHAACGLSGFRFWSFLSCFFITLKVTDFQAPLLLSNITHGRDSYKMIPQMPLPKCHFSLHPAGAEMLQGEQTIHNKKKKNIYFLYITLSFWNLPEVITSCKQLLNCLNFGECWVLW